MAPCLMRLCVALIVCNALNELPPARASPTSTVRLNDNGYDSSIKSSDDFKTTSSLALAEGSGKELTRSLNLSGFLANLQDLNDWSRIPLLPGQGREVQTIREEDATSETAGSTERGSEDSRGFLASSRSELQPLMTRDKEVLETAFREQDGVGPQLFEEDQKKQPHPIFSGTQPSAVVNNLAYNLLQPRRPIYRRDGQILGVTWWQAQQGNSGRTGQNSNPRSPFRPPGLSRSQNRLSERNSKDDGQNLTIGIIPHQGNDSKNSGHNFDHQDQGQVTGDDSEQTKNNLTFPLLLQTTLEQNSHRTAGNTNQVASSPASLSKKFQAVHDEGRIFEKTQQNLTAPSLMQSPGEENGFEPLSNKRQDDWPDSSEAHNSKKGRQKDVKMSGLENPLWLSRPASSERTGDNFWHTPSNIPLPAVNSPGSHGAVMYGGNLLVTGQGQQQGVSVILHVVNETTSAISQGSYLQYDPVTGQIISVTGTNSGNSSDPAGVVVGYLQVDHSRPILHPGPYDALHSDNDPIFGLISLDDPSLQANGSDLSTVIQNGAYLQFNPLGASTQQADTTNKQLAVYLQLAPEAQAMVNKNAGQSVYLQFDPTLNGLLGTNTGSHVLASAGNPTRNLFLRMFREGEIYIDGGAVVQNFYTDGDFGRTLAHFRALPLEGVGYLEGGHTLGGQLKGYTVTACGLCGPRREPMIEFVSKFSTNPVIKRRFLYVPKLPAPAFYVGGTTVGGRGHHGMGAFSAFPPPLHRNDVGGLRNHVPMFDDGKTYSSAKERRRTLVGPDSKLQLALQTPQDVGFNGLNTSLRNGVNQGSHNVSKGMAVGTRGQKHISRQNYQLANT